MPFPPGWALGERRVTKARSRAPRGKPPLTAQQAFPTQAQIQAASGLTASSHSARSWQDLQAASVGTKGGEKGKREEREEREGNQITGLNTSIHQRPSPF